MAGPSNLGVGDAGFGSYVKTYKPWFIGRDAFVDQEKNRKAETVRFRFNDKGVRMAHQGDPVISKRGKVIGEVTSCAADKDGYLLGQAYVDMRFSEENTPVLIYQGANSERIKAPSDMLMGDRVTIPTEATIIRRFPK
jgi:glycine hydroxymethyltransferase